MKPGLLLLATLFATYPGVAQKLKKSDKEVSARLLAETGALQKDTGAAGRTYILARFAEFGMSMKVNKDVVDAGRIIGPGCVLSLDGKKAMVGSDFFPLGGSLNAHASGSSGVSLNEGGLPWIHDLKDDLDGGLDVRKSMEDRVVEAKKKGATALILYNSSNQADHLNFDSSSKETYVLPVVYITKGFSVIAFKDPTAYVEVELTVNISEKRYTLYETQGYIDNNADKTIVLQASQDSTAGAAGLIELARLVKRAGWKKNNYLFITYTGDFLTRTPPSTPGSVQSVVDLDSAFRNIQGYDGEALAVRTLFKNLEASERK